MKRFTFNNKEICYFKSLMKIFVNSFAKIIITSFLDRLTRCEKYKYFIYRFFE